MILAIRAVLACFLLSSAGAVNRGYKQSGGAIDRSKRETKPVREFGGAIVKTITSEDETISFKVSERDHARVVVASDNEDVEYSISEPGKKAFKGMGEMIGKGTPGLKTTEALYGLRIHEGAVKLKSEASGELQVQAAVKQKGRQGHRRSLAESTTVAILNPGSNINVCFETTEQVHFVGETVDLKIGLCDKGSDFIYPSGVVSGSVVFKSSVGSSSIDVPASGEDGWSIASFPPAATGAYSFQINIEGSDDGGVTTFERQGNGVFTVSEKQLKSVESVSLQMEEMEGHEYALLSINLELEDGYVASEDDHFLVLADIVDGNNREVVEASAITDLEQTATGWALELIVQPEWFEERTESTYSLEYLRISSVEAAPLIIAEDVPIETTEVILVRNRRLSETSEDRELRMTQGLRPSAHTDTNRNLRRELQQNGIVAAHGYCSGDAWANYLGPGVAKFQDFDQNRSIDQFAQLLRTFAEQQFQGCSIIAHSQGGMAALHLYTYYWSCLDYAPAGRLIQTVGTPFQGTALAGNAAGLGDVFGVGCGTNYDLSYAGASNWLAGIPSWARSQVYYWTTSFEDRWWAYDYCQIVTDVLLGDPDDGTTEKAKAQLPGANNRGHKEGWCHTTDMRDPPQCSDSSRNSEMLTYAAQ